MSKTQQGNGSERAFHECSMGSGVGSDQPEKVRLKGADQTGEATEGQRRVWGKGVGLRGHIKWSRGACWKFHSKG